MPNINAMRESKFLKRDQCNPPILVTIDGVDQQNVAKEGAPEELKWCIHFVEVDRPMVLNSTNAQLIAKIVGSEETESWPGKQVVLYDDPTVSFGGKIVGGIRVRAPKLKTAAKPAAPIKAKPTPAAEPAQGEDPDVGF